MHHEVRQLENGGSVRNGRGCQGFDGTSYACSIISFSHPKNNQHNNETTQLVAGHITLDLRTRKACIGSQEIELPGREFNLAEAFFQQQGQVLSRAQLLDRVWGYDYDPSSNIVDVYVGYLRKKLGNDVIETIRGIGYRLQLS